MITGDWKCKQTYAETDDKEIMGNDENICDFFKAAQF